MNTITCLFPGEDRTDAIGPLTFFGSYCGMALHGDHPTHTRKHMKEMQRGFPDRSMEGRAMEAWWYLNRIDKAKPREDIFNVEAKMTNYTMKTLSMLKKRRI